MFDVKPLEVKPFGPLSEDEIAAIKDAPHGEALKIIREHDPAYGYEGKNLYEVTIVKEETIIHEANVKVAAPDEKTAEKIIKKKGKYWNYDFKESLPDTDTYISGVRCLD